MIPDVCAVLASLKGEAASPQVRDLLRGDDSSRLTAAR